MRDAPARPETTATAATPVVIIFRRLIKLLIATPTGSSPSSGSPAHNHRAHPAPKSRIDDHRDMHEYKQSQQVRQHKVNGTRRLLSAPHRHQPGKYRSDRRRHRKPSQ